MTMLPLVLTLALGPVGQTAETAPERGRDQYLYLTSQFDTDAFAPAGRAARTTGRSVIRGPFDAPIGQGDGAATGGFDGLGASYPDDLLPQGRTFEVDSTRFGKIVFLRPSTEEGAKNAMSLNGQTIRVKTKKRFNVLLSLGATHATEATAGGRAQRGDVHLYGNVVLRFTDGTRARAPIGLSDWIGTPVFHEEAAFEAPYRQVGRRTSNSAVRSGQTLHLWLQRTPIPSDKVLASITLPKIPDAKVIALTLAWRDGVALPARKRLPRPEPAPVAIFAEPDFPRLRVIDTVTPERIRASLEKVGIAASLLGIDHLRDRKLFTRQAFPVLVLPHGTAFPLQAVDALREYRKSGGAVVHSALSFTLPIERTAYGTWLASTRLTGFEGHEGDSALGTPRYGPTTQTRVWPSPELEAWGLGDLPWSNYAMADIWGRKISLQSIDADTQIEGIEITPLLKIGSWTSNVACIVRQTKGDFTVAVHGPGR